MAETESDTWTGGKSFSEADIVRKVEGLLRVAGKTTSEAEAAAMTAKAHALLEKYNLDIATIEQGGGGSGAREQGKVTGGLYHFQRDLWEAVAELNFCLYWNQYVFDKTKIGRRRDRWGQVHKRQGGYRFVHQVVGRKVNVAMTRTMAEYLEQAIERNVRARLDQDGTQFFTRWANSYREGMAARLVEKISERRLNNLAAERKKQHAETAKASEGHSTSRAITVSTVVKQERDANIDFIYGEGTSAKWAAERAEQARAQAEADAEYAKWAAAHPEEARKEAEEERKRARRRGAGRQSYRDRKTVDHGGYRSGIEDARNVSIDPQVDQPVQKRLGR